MVGAEAGVERDAQALRATRDDVALLPHAAQPRRQAAERVAHGGRLARREVAQLGLAQPRAPARGGEPGEERVRRALELVQHARRRGGVVEPAGPLAIAPQLRDVTQREPAPSHSAAASSSSWASSNTTASCSGSTPIAPSEAMRSPRSAK